MISIFKKYQPEITGSLLCLLLGLLSGYSVNASDPLWYIHLNKPSFNPPAWIFGPAWTVLYLMMGAALGRLWKEKTNNKMLIVLFIIQFIFNLAWSPLFFYFHRIDWALADIGALWLSLLIFMIAARHHRSVFLLCLPYLLWVSFAAFLNFSIYTMNIR